MKTELILQFHFEASHSLDEYETPHPHLWCLECSISGEPIEGKILDIVKIRFCVQLLVNDIHSTYLNENIRVSENVRKFPTCETLSVFFKEYLEKIVKNEFYSLNSSIRLESVFVSISTIEKVELGAIRLTLN